MKYALATILALGAAAPALANEQLARSLGVEPGQYTLEQLVLLQARSSFESNDGRVNLDNLPNVAARSLRSPVEVAPSARN